MPDALGNRQVRRDGDERPQIQLLECDRAAFRRRCAACERHAQVRRRERRAVRKRERQLLRRDARLRIGAPPLDATAEMGERQRRKAVAQCRADILELEVGRYVDGQRIGEIDPHAKRTLAALDRHRERQPLAPRGDIGVIEAHVELALQLVPVLQRFAGHVGAKLERCGELGGRNAGQPGLMPSEALLEPEGDVVEQQLGRLPVFVVPRDERVADDHLRLPHQPIRDGGIVAGVAAFALDAGEMQPPCRVAAHRKPWTLDQQFLQPQLEERQRSPRDDQVDARQSSNTPRSSSFARTRKPRTESFGFQPSQPVTKLSISTDWPIRFAIQRAMSSRRASTCGKTTSRIVISSAKNAPASSTADIATSRRTSAAKDGVDEVAGIMKVR
jgi:hypothetical protein